MNPERKAGSPAGKEKALVRISLLHGGLLPEGGSVLDDHSETINNVLDGVIAGISSPLHSSVERQFGNRGLDLLALSLSTSRFASNTSMSRRETIASRTISASTSGGTASHCTVSPSKFAVRGSSFLGRLRRQIQRLRLLSRDGNAHHIEPGLFAAIRRRHVRDEGGNVPRKIGEHIFAARVEVAHMQDSDGPVALRDLFGKLMLLGDEIITAAGLHLHAKAGLRSSPVAEPCQPLRTGEAKFDLG